MEPDMTEEDEAFDELAKRQGMWGGGFHAKRAAAADKLFEDQINYGTSWSKDGERIDPTSVYLDEPAQWPMPTVEIEYTLSVAEPAQEPVALVIDGVLVKSELPEKYTGHLYTTPPKRERVLFPTMLRKMWSGGEVQAWLDENVNKEKNT
jgi:hypothetical protein